MGDWEDICDQHGKSMSDSDEWIFDMYSSGDSMEHSSEEKIFRTLQEAREYAMGNLGSVFTRASDGQGFILKTTTKSSQTTHLNSIKNSPNLILKKVWPKIGQLNLNLLQKILRRLNSSELEEFKKMIDSQITYSYENKKNHEKHMKEEMQHGGMRIKRRKGYEKSLYYISLSISDFKAMRDEINNQLY